MSRFKLNRRAVLRGAGGVAIALPWLEIMTSGRTSQAVPPTAQRFISVFQPGGTVLSEWRPAGTETNFELSPILAPFEPVKDQIVVLDGIDMPSAIGEQHQAGMVALLTGTPQVSGSGSYGSGPSIDQVIAPQLAPRSIPTLEQAVRWGTGKSHGLVSPINILNFEDNPTWDPIPPRLDPVDTFNLLFGGLPAERDAALDWDRSILDAVAGRYERLAPRLGAEDKAKLDEHLTQIRAIEQTLVGLDATPGCAVPELVDTSSYNPDAGLDSDDDGSVRDPETDAAIPVVGKLMMDMLVMAFACDLSAVGTLQWSDSEAKYTLPWLDLPGNEGHNFYQNDGGYQPVECAKIATWYSEQHAYLLQELARVDMGGHSLLDESVVFFGSQLQNPATHVKDDMPFVLAGQGGGLRTGRYLTFDGESHNDLLISVLNLFGDARTSFGDPKYCSGPLVNLP